MDGFTFRIGPNNILNIQYPDEIVFMAFGWGNDSTGRTEYALRIIYMEKQAVVCSLGNDETNARGMFNHIVEKVFKEVNVLAE